MKIISYNLNGIRASKKLGLLDWMMSSDVDIFCLQEIRANEKITREIFADDEQVSLFNESGKGYPFYKFYNCGQIPGYAGTMILSKIKPDNVTYGIGDLPIDNEGRVMTAFYGNLAIVNAYIPNGNSRLDFKMRFLEKLTNYLNQLKANYSVVCVGDFNIANDEIDLTNPKECKNKSVFLPIERTAFKKILSLGYVDTFRTLYPEKREYTWRSYRSRQENLPENHYNAWKYRIDYALLYNKDNYKIKECDILDLPYSDHLPVILTLETK